MPFKETENLGWISEATHTPPPAPLKPEPKDPAAAFLISLVIPGMGQLYCGERGRGIRTLALFGLCVALVVWLSSSLSGSNEYASVAWGIAFRAGLALYAFAFVDAYFTAREKSEGVYALYAYNPRVAAILNLLTRGFGYWYLDEKGKGVLLFVVVGVANRAAIRMTGPVADALGIFVEVALAAMAVDAYRLAKNKNEQKMGPIIPSATELTPASGLQPHVPIALASLIATAYVGLITVGLVLPDYEKIDQSGAIINDMADGKSYRNPKYAIEMQVPLGWELDQSEPGFFVSASAMEGACAVAFVPSAVFPFQSVESLGKEIVQEVRKQSPNTKFQEIKQSQLAGHTAHELVAVSSLEGLEMQQNFVIVKYAFAVYTLVTTSEGPVAEACNADVAKIRERIVLPN